MTQWRDNLAQPIGHSDHLYAIFCKKKKLAKAKRRLLSKEKMLTVKMRYGQEETPEAYHLPFLSPQFFVLISCYNLSIILYEIQSRICGKIRVMCHHLNLLNCHKIIIKQIL